jgi:hypothetical protein
MNKISRNLEEKDESLDEGVCQDLYEPCLSPQPHLSLWELEAEDLIS